MKSLANSHLRAPVKKTADKRKVGDGTPGPGRPKGSPNKTTASVKQALTEAFEELGGVPSLVKWAREKPSDFYGLWGKLIPAEVKASVTGEDGGPVEIVVSYVAHKG